jgi:hypothetical protein
VPAAALEEKPMPLMSAVPFPSLRHAHHLVTQRPTPTLGASVAGARPPPGPPTSRDESAIERMSNYSIRPCRHDASLTMRFGARSSSAHVGALPPSRSPRDEVMVGTVPASHSSHSTSVGSTPRAAAAPVPPLGAAALVGLKGISGTGTPLTRRISEHGNSTPRSGAMRVTVSKRDSVPSCTLATHGLPPLPDQTD